MPTGQEWYLIPFRRRVCSSQEGGARRYGGLKGKMWNHSTHVPTRAAAAASGVSGGRSEDITPPSLKGKASGDQLGGGQGSDTILGQRGKDNIRGGLGGDALYGNADGDTILGGPAEDVAFPTPPTRKAPAGRMLARRGHREVVLDRG